MKFSIKDFFNKCDIKCDSKWSHLLRKSLMENFIFRAVKANSCKLNETQLRQIPVNDFDRL